MGYNGWLTLFIVNRHGENNMKHLCIITLVTLMIVVSAIATKAGIDTITDYATMRNETIQDI